MPLSESQQRLANRGRPCMGSDQGNWGRIKVSRDGRPLAVGGRNSLPPPRLRPKSPPVRPCARGAGSARGQPHRNHYSETAAANAHLNGYVGEIHQANRIATTMPNEVIVLWGNRVTQNGSDIVTVNRLTGEVTLWDNKFRSANRSIGSSATFQPGSRSFLNARAQAERAILNSNLSAHLRAQALRNLLEGNVRTITSGSGHALNSVFVQPPAK